MQCISQIMKQSRQLAIKASQAGITPLIVEAGDVGAILITDLPVLGSYIPDGWALLHELYVRKTQNTDWAFNESLNEAMTAGRGYAVIAENERQFRVGEYTN